MVQQAKLRAAGRTGNGLGMETPICRVVVFQPAVGAEREGGHGGPGPVVGDSGDDAVAGTAVGAGDERVAVTAVGRVEELTQAVSAEGRVGRHLDVLLSVCAGEDGEAALREHGDILRGTGRDNGQGREFVGQGVPEGKKRPCRPLDFDLHPGRDVAHPAAQVEFTGPAEDEGAKPDALDDAADEETPADYGFSVPEVSH